MPSDRHLGADLDHHEVLAGFDPSRIRTTDLLGERGRTLRVREHRQLWTGAAEDLRCLVGRRVVGDDGLQQSSLGASLRNASTLTASWISTSTPLLKATRLSLGRVSPESDRECPPWSTR
jgi:hypothetical protein